MLGIGGGGGGEGKENEMNKKKKQKHRAFLCTEMPTYLDRSVLSWLFEWLSKAFKRPLKVL